MRRKAILMIVSVPVYKACGGLDFVIRDTIRALAKNSTEYYFILIGPSFLEYYQEEDYLFLYPCDKVMHDFSWLGNHDIRLVHAFDCISASLGMQLSEMLEKPFIFELQLSATYEKSSFSGAWTSKQNAETLALDEQNAFRTADLIITCSRYYTEYIKPHNPKVLVLYNGVDISQFSTPNRAPLPGWRRNRILYIGRFQYMKGVDQILEAEIPDSVDMYFAGGANESPLFANILESCRVRDNFHYIGWISGEQKRDVLCAVDAVIYPSRHEPFGIVALEALASKSILLSSFSGGMKEFLDPGVAINCGDSAQTISAAVRQFLSMNDQEKSAMIARGAEVANNFTWEKRSQKLLAIYANMER